MARIYPIIAAIALTINVVALIAAIVSLVTPDWVVIESSDITYRSGLWKYCPSYQNECVDMKFEGSNGTKLHVVRAFMILAVLALAVDVVTVIYLLCHMDSKPVKYVAIAIGCMDISATVCLLIAVAVYAQIATDGDAHRDLHTSFYLAIGAIGVIVMLLLTTAKI